MQPSIWKTAAGRVLEKAQAAVWQPALWRFRSKNTIVIVNSRFIAISLPFDWFAYTVYVVYTVIIQDVDSCRLLSFYPGPKDFHFHLEFKHWRNSMKFLPPNHALELAQAEALKSCCYHNVMIELCSYMQLWLSCIMSYVLIMHLWSSEFCLDSRSQRLGKCRTLYKIIQGHIMTYRCNLIQIYTNTEYWMSLHNP